MEDYCFASWFLTEKCNFDCSYCSIVNPPKYKKILGGVKKFIKSKLKSSSDYNLYEELDNVIQRFLGTGEKITFGFTGGEPLIYPHFIDICRRIAEYDNFKISLDTNLSTNNIHRFIDAVPPEKVEYIYAALHVLERERIFGEIGSFIDTVVLLKNKGYSIGVNYVMHPALFTRVERDYKYCLDRGVQLKLKKFKGVYNNRVYPRSYSEEQKHIMLKYSSAGKKDIFQSRNFYGRKCNAGKNIIRIKTNGDITRCVGDHSLLGNIFTGFELYETARPCILKTCPCFSPDRLFAGLEADTVVPPRLTLAAKLREKRNRLRGWWDQD